MPIYHRLGDIPKKRHTVFRRPDGGLYAEELMGHEGFVGTSSLLYHSYPPTTVKSARRIRDITWEADDDTSLRHRHFLTARAKKGGSPTLDRIPLLFNSDIAMLYVEPDEIDAHFYRNSQADEVVYVVEGSGTLESVYGDLPYTQGDYVVIHRNITHRWKLDDGGKKTKLLVFESRGHVRWPKRYRNEFGQLLEGAPYSERDIRRPVELRPHDEKGDFRILVKQYDALNELILDHHPFDVVGWDGYVYPFTFNAQDFEPITGTVHQPPPIHQTFEIRGYVVCTFAPRMLDTHPEAVRIPWVHDNVEADEVLFYVRGNFGSRRGIEPASITLHPRGIPHGPHPGTIMASKNATRTEELAVMFDTQHTLELTEQAVALDDQKYPQSWLD